MNEFYSQKPNTYSYREVTNNIQHIKFCTCATGRWFSPGTPPIKLAAGHYITIILLKVALTP